MYMSIIPAGQGANVDIFLFIIKFFQKRFQCSLKKSEDFDIIFFFRKYSDYFSYTHALLYKNKK